MIIDAFYKLKYTVYKAGQAKRNDYQFVAANLRAETVRLMKVRDKALMTPKSSLMLVPGLELYLQHSQSQPRAVPDCLLCLL